MRLSQYVPFPVPKEKIDTIFHMLYNRTIKTDKEGKTMKKLNLLAAVLCIAAIAMPLTADAGFNVGNAIKVKLPGKTTSQAPAKTAPAPQAKKGGYANLNVTCDGAPVPYANVYIGMGIEYRVEDGKCHVIGKSNIGGMTSDKGLAEIAFTEQGWNMVVFKVGYEPILVRNVLLPSDHVLTTTKNAAVKGVKFD